MAPARHMGQRPGLSIQMGNVMQRYILVYGGIAGLLVISTIALGLIFSGSNSGAGSELAGYLIMLVALSLIFVATKRYRDRDLGGVIRFGRAFALGLGISAVAGVVYVAVWEAYLAATDYAFMDEYAAGILTAEREAGLGANEMAALEQRMAEMQANYAKPWIRIPITFTEIFPIGAIVSLISAAVLRNPRRSD